MKSRKITSFQAEEQAKELLKNEVNIRKACLKTANQKVDELIEKIKSGDASKKVQKELAEQNDIVNGIMEWLKKNDKTA